jgi:tetratricopeptide (TPR) repeat protein
MKTRLFILFGFLCTFISVSTFAQPALDVPLVSQRAEVKQRLGYTDITVVYYSPYVSGRAIWGDLVPYGKVWRAGANENTTISFTDEISISGHTLPAGTYGLHMIPNADEWVVIFSKNHTSWGSFFYNEGEDALRIKVKPQTREFQEWLDYTFTDRAAASCNATLSWEKVKVAIPITVDVNTIALRHIREQLKNLPGFNWHGLEEGTHFCVEHKVNYDEALKWINRSIQIEENFTNIGTKAQLLKLMGNTAGAVEAKKQMLKLAEVGSENSVNIFGYQLMNEDDMPSAIEVFKINVKKHPDSWNAYDSMAEAYGKAGDNKQSITNYKLALSKAPDDQKERIKKAITGLQKG